MSNSHNVANVDRIAIIGMAGRFPGAKNVEQFWRNLRDGVESILPFSDEELLSSGIDPARLKDPSYVRAGAILDQIEWFDADFFGYAPREAEIIDPQQRLFLECAWEALEVAGYDPARYGKPIGVYAGITANAYLMNNLYPNRWRIDLNDLQAVTGNEKDYLTTRVSYKLNLTGPSITVQTACSTSLVAVHLACDALLNGQCDMALAGGVCLNVPQKAGYLYIEGAIYSPDGHCRAFDADGRGTVFGSGVGIVVLKRLANALEDGDAIDAVIIGSAINNDGSGKVGYTAPSVTGQAKVIKEALEMADVDPEAIAYIEAHGTGTPLGDPIEVAALTQAFGTGGNRKGSCAIGSVKTNVGHLNSAAGIAGLIKTVLALKGRMIPPSLNFSKPNPKINFKSSPFYVNTTLRDWKTEGVPRRAGVSSFGVGGTNAHVVLEEAPSAEPSTPSRAWQLLMLSARTKAALETATTNLAEHLKQHPGLNLADVAYTLQLGRKAMKYRRMAVCYDQDDALNVLQTRDPKRVATSVDEPKARHVIFMFTGQGAQYIGMALELYQTEPTFQQHVDRCSELLKPHLGLDLRSILYPSHDRVDEATQQLTQTAITQPALFVVEYALARLFMEWGIEPQAMIGHSIGEYVAASLAGVFSLEDGLLLVASRGRLMNQLPAGSMLAIPLPEKEVQALLSAGLSLATINAPSACVLSGPSEAVYQLEKKLVEKGIEGRRLHTSHAFHSSMMEPILDPFKNEVSKITLNAPKIPYLSNVTGTWVTKEQATDPDYWARHIRRTVRFSEGVGELLKEPGCVLLEVGPGETLTQLVRRRTDKVAGQVILSSIRHPREKQSDVAFLLGTLGRLWLAGIEVDWAKFYKGERRHRVALPTYPFERQRYWVEPAKEPSDGVGMKRITASSAKRQNVNDWFYVPSWKRTIPAKAITERGLTNQKHSWLVFVDRCHLGARIVNRLKKEGSAVISVMIGEQFRQTSEDTFTVNPRIGKNYSALFRELKGLNRVPDRIVHLWGVTQKARLNKEIEDFEISQYLGFYSLLFLIQAMGHTNQRDSIQLDIITNYVHEVTGEDVLCPEKATVLGPCKVIPQEFPNIKCRNIDIIFPASGDGQEDILIDQIRGELAAKPSGQVVAYRGQHRWVQIYEAIKLDGSPEGASNVLKDGGVYLITGGLGGIGLTLAEYFAQTVRAKLILIARRILPARDEWDQWLKSHNELDVISQKIQKIKLIEELGSEVMVLGADVVDENQMKTSIARVYEHFGLINGVVHAAGVAGGGVIELKTPEMAERVLSPKVKGTLVLGRLLKGVKLDFFTLCSSMISVVGGIGQVDYCGANAFLDAYANKNFLKNNTVSINWYAWQEVGMAVNTPITGSLKEERERTLKLGILPEEGKEAFGRILNSSCPQVVVSTQNLSNWTDLDKDSGSSYSMEETVKTPLSKPAYDRPTLSSTYVAPRNEIERAVAEIWQETLGIDAVGIYDDYFELGGDSLMAIRLLSRIVETFKIEMPLESLLEARTIEQFVEKLTRAKGGEKLSEIVDVREKRGIETPAGKLANSEPRTSTERRLLLIWERVLNASPIGIRDSFIDLQGDSDLFDRMLVEVRSEFGMFAEGLSVKAIYQEPTIEALARTIDDSMKPTKTLVVGLQSRGSKRPLFLIHAGGGYVFFYRALAYCLGQDRPVYAVRAETISDGNGRPFGGSRSIEELAARYIAEIKTVQPKGPYSLGGACLGGVIAFEMAQQLRSHGEEIVGPVLLFDAFVMNSPYISKDDVTVLRDAGLLPETLRNRISKHLAHTIQIGLVKGVWYISGKIAHKASWEMAKATRRVTGRLQAFSSQLMGQLRPKVPSPDGTPDGVELIQRRIMAEFLKTSSRLLSKYVPNVYEGSIVLFKAKEGPDPEGLWTGLTQGGLAVHQMPGVHLDMMEEPAVIATAALVREYLQRDCVQTGAAAQNGMRSLDPRGHNETIDEGQLIQLSAGEHHDS